jgi:hypothetical protein
MRLELASIAAAALLALPPASAAEDVSALAARKAGALALMHQKAERALVTAAQDKVFVQYFDADTPEARARLKPRIDQVALGVQARFQVAEMCLIGRDGGEVSRVVGRTVADDLDPDETGNPFFGPTFLQEPRTVYVAPPYLSDDAHAWVVAYATPLAVGDATPAILHYEHRLDAYQAVLAEGLAGPDRFALLVDPRGWVVGDSRRPVPVAERDGVTESDAYFAPFRLAGLDLAGLEARLGGGKAGAGALADGDATYDVAYRTVEGWTVVAAERRR